jgi:hypothetical protein
MHTDRRSPAAAAKLGHEACFSLGDTACHAVALAKEGKMVTITPLAHHEP